MRFVNLKKCFSVVLALSVLVPNVFAEKDNFKKSDTGDRTVNTNDLKKIARKSAPYVALGVPSVAILTTVAILWAKHGNKPPVTENNGNDHVAGDTSSSKPPVIPPRPQVQITQDDIEKSINECNLPGIEFYFVKNTVYKNYYFYIITNLGEANAYFRTRKIPQAGMDLICKWQNHIIYQNDVMSGRDFTVNAIFGSESSFAKDFGQIIRNVNDKSSEEKQQYEYKLPEDVKDISGGEPVVREDESRDNPIGVLLGAKMHASVNQAAGMHRNEDLWVAIPAKGSNKPLDTGKPDAATQQTHPSKNGTKSGDVVRAAELTQDIEKATLVVGNAESPEQAFERSMKESLEKGSLPGFKFYQYEPTWPRSTRYCYIITDYKRAKASLKDTDGNAWKKVVLYQNRWLEYKGNDEGWSFENLFGFKSGFGNYFNQITKVSKNERQGFETLEDLPRGCTYNFGCRVFARSDGRLGKGNHDIGTLDIISPESDIAVSFAVFENRVNKHQLKN